jgi:pimeloyl-ACP methyl ester carboxylesterase
VEVVLGSRCWQNRPVSRLLLVFVVGCAVAAGCGGNGHAARDHPARLSPTPFLSGVSDSGRLVSIGDGRSLFMDCIGSGTPTILLEAGLGGNTHNWDAVHARLGETARTCAYDRAGSGNSVGPPGVRDAAEEIDDLQRLLAAAKLPGPYVLVGHSYGGLLVRLFAHAHPKDTAGIVLVDAVGRDQIRRTEAVWPKAEFRRLRRAVTQPVSDGVNLAASEALGDSVRTLGQTPLVVVTAGSESFGGAPPRLTRALDRLWTTMQDELAALSGDHVHVVALRSDHFVQAADGQPDVVIRAVRAVVDAAREDTALPPCPRIFHRARDRCRA